MRLLQGRGDQDRPAVEGAAELAHGLVHDRVVERVAGSEQVGSSEAFAVDLAELEGDAVVLGGDRSLAGRADLLGHVGDLVAALLALRDPTAEPGERCLERQLDVVRLETSSAGLVHRGAERLKVGLGEVLRGEGAFLEEVLEAVTDGGVDDLVHLGLHVGAFAVLDGVEQEVAQRRLGEGFAEDVEDLAAVGLAHLVELLQQSGEDLALAGVGGDEVPQAADLLLADAVDAAETLLDAVGVPRQVVVDHQVRGLKVEALAGGVGGEQDLDVAVLGELLGDQTPFTTAHASVDRLDRVRLAEQGADLALEVVQGVAVLGEDDELPRPPVAVRGQRVVLEDRGQLGPLAVGAGLADLLGGLDEVGQLDEFGVELLDRLRGGGRVHHVFLELLQLFGVVLVLVELADVDGGLGVAVGAVEDLGLLALQPLAAADEAPVDRLRDSRRGDAAGR